MMLSMSTHSAGAGVAPGAAPLSGGGNPEHAPRSSPRVVRLETPVSSSTMTEAGGHEADALDTGMIFHVWTTVRTLNLVVPGTRAALDLSFSPGIDPMGQDSHDVIPALLHLLNFKVSSSPEIHSGLIFRVQQGCHERPRPGPVRWVPDENKRCYCGQTESFLTASR